MVTDSRESQAHRLTNALTAACLSDEYKAALEVWQAEGATSDDRWNAWLTLVTVALRDGRVSLAFVDDIPNKRIPGFREANDEITKAMGKVLTLKVDLETRKVVGIELVAVSSNLAKALRGAQEPPAPLVDERPEPREYR